jgi:hypothetical protein
MTERIAGRLCCNRQNPKAMGCKSGLVPEETANRNNSNLAQRYTTAGFFERDESGKAKAGTGCRAEARKKDRTAGF